MVNYLPNSILKTKTKIVKHGSIEFCSVMAIFSWVQGLPRSVNSIPSEIPMQKTNFFITSWCQLQMASWLGVSAHIYFPISVHLSETRTCVGLVLVFTASVSLYMCIRLYYHMFHYFNLPHFILFLWSYLWLLVFIWLTLLPPAPPSPSSSPICTCMYL